MAEIRAGTEVVPAPVVPAPVGVERDVPDLLGGERVVPAPAGGGLMNTTVTTTVIASSPCPRGRSDRATTQSRV